MKVKKNASSGTLESSDVMVSIFKNEEGLSIDLESPVKKQFGSQITKVVKECCEKLNIDHALIKVVDRGALDCTIRARVETALYRACESTNYNWEVNPNGNC